MYCIYIYIYIYKVSQSVFKQSYSNTFQHCFALFPLCLKSLTHDHPYCASLPFDQIHPPHPPYPQT